MTIALCWESTRGFEKWVDSFDRLMSQQFSDAGVMHDFWKNMPVTWSFEMPSGSLKGDMTRPFNPENKPSPDKRCNVAAEAFDIAASESVRQRRLAIFKETFETVGSR